MGQARQRTQAFFQHSPLCIFCGGQEPATTVEHCPPRALFIRKEWPAGFDFPACRLCNNGTSDDDAIVSLLGRMDPLNPNRGADGRTPWLMQDVHNQGTNFLLDMFNVSTRDARVAMRRLNIQPEQGRLRRHSGVVNVPVRADEAVMVFARKLSKAVFYKSTGTIFPGNGEIMFNWFTNATMLEHGAVPVLDYAAQFNSEPIPVTRNRQDLSAQFECRISRSSDNSLLIVQALFGATFGFVAVCSRTPEILAGIDARWREQFGDDGLFRFI